MAQPRVRGPGTERAAFSLELRWWPAFRGCVSPAGCRPWLPPDWARGLSSTFPYRQSLSEMFHMVLESPEYMPSILEPSTKLGLSRGSVSVCLVNELTARFYRLWTQMPSEAKQTVQMNEVGDGNNRECWGLHVSHSKGQPLFSSGHLLPCGNVDHLLPHLIFQEKPKSRLLWWAPDFFMLWTNFKLFKLSEGQTKHMWLVDHWPEDMFGTSTLKLQDVSDAARVILLKTARQRGQEQAKESQYHQHP